MNVEQSMVASGKRKVILLTGLILLFGLIIRADAAVLPQPSFTIADQITTQSGYVKLNWQWEGVRDDAGLVRFELQQAESLDFSAAEPLYFGRDYATFLSGLPEGDYYYRVRAVREGWGASSWSAPLQVHVRHHSLQLAVWMFGLGAVIFLLTVAIVVFGSRAANRSFE